MSKICIRIDARLAENASINTMRVPVFKQDTSTSQLFAHPVDPPGCPQTKRPIGLRLLDTKTADTVASVEELSVIWRPRILFARELDAYRLQSIYDLFSDTSGSVLWRALRDCDWSENPYISALLWLEIARWHSVPACIILRTDDVRQPWMLISSFHLVSTPLTESDDEPDLSSWEEGGEKREHMEHIMEYNRRTNREGSLGTDLLKLSEKGPFAIDKFLSNAQKRGPRSAAVRYVIEDLHRSWTRDATNDELQAIEEKRSRARNSVEVLESDVKTCFSESVASSSSEVCDETLIVFAPDQHCSLYYAPENVLTSALSFVCPTPPTMVSVAPHYQTTPDILYMARYVNQHTLGRYIPALFRRLVRLIFNIGDSTEPLSALWNQSWIAHLNRRNAMEEYFVRFLAPDGPPLPWFDYAHPTSLWKAVDGLARGGQSADPFAGMMGLNTLAFYMDWLERFLPFHVEADWTTPGRVSEQSTKSPTRSDGMLQQRGSVRLGWVPGMETVRLPMCRVYGLISTVDHPWITIDKWFTSEGLRIENMSVDTWFLVHSNSISPWNQPESHAAEVASAFRETLFEVFDTSLAVISDTVSVQVQTTPSWFWLSLSVTPEASPLPSVVWRIVPRKRKTTLLPGFAFLAFDTSFDALAVLMHFASTKHFKITTRSRSPLPAPTMEVEDTKSAIAQILKTPVTSLTQCAVHIDPLVLLTQPQHACVLWTLRSDEERVSRFYLFMYS